MVNKENKSQSNNVRFLINAQYLKDISFENPKAPNSLKKFAEDPKIQVDVDVKSKPLNQESNNIFEVELIIKAETKSSGESLFIVEASYCGIFTVENAKDELLDKILLIECPKFLFPFLRSTLAFCTREGGFPPLMISPVDFASMYDQKKRQ